MILCKYYVFCKYYEVIMLSSNHLPINNTELQCFSTLNMLKKDSMILISVTVASNMYSQNLNYVCYIMTGVT